MSSGSDAAPAPHEELGAEAPTPRTAAAMGRLKSILLSDRAARWTARLSLILIWQLVGDLSERMPTPIDTFNFIIDEFQRPYEGTEATLWNNQVVQNTYLTVERTALGMLWVIAIGIPLGYAMGTWWRAQATFTDIVMVGLALPGYIWALLSLMWFGFSVTAPVFTVAVSATPALVVFVMRGTLAIPRELRDMSQAYEVPFMERFRNLVLPSMAGAVIAGVRLAILAGWGLVLVTEWFGLSDGAGQQSRSWYDAANFDGLMGWALIIIAIIIVFDRVIIERIDRRAHRWRSRIEGFGTSRGPAG
jgi:ABC-type nitrate/sulfonate/bicarbonate transport system permease component